MSMSQEQMRSWVSLFFAFLLSLLILGVTLLNLMRFVWLDSSFLFSTMEEVKYYQLVQDHMDEIIEARGTPFGIPEDLLDGILTEKQVKQNVGVQLQNQMAGSMVEVDTAGLENEIRQRLENYLEQQDVPIFEEHKESMREFVDLIRMEYLRNTTLPITGAYLWAKTTLSRYHPYVMLGLLFFMAMSMMVIFGIHRGREKGIYLAYGLMGSGWMLVIFPGWLLLQGVMDRIQLAPEYLYRLISAAGERILWQVLCIGVFWLIFGAILYALSNRKGQNQA